MKEEYEFSYKALAFLISGDESERKSILQGVKPEYFPEPCFGDILTAVSKMTEESKPVDLLTVLSGDILRDILGLIFQESCS